MSGMTKKEYDYIESTQQIIATNQRVLVDPNTGEDFVVQQQVKRFNDNKQFWKVYLMDFLTVLGILDSKQLDILVYILEHTHSATNMFLGTYKEISKQCKVSEPTIAAIMKKLQERNFIKKVRPGVWFISPDIMMKGNTNKRNLLISYYNDSKIPPKTNMYGIGVDDDENSEN